ncbi:putative adipose-regulatory protein-domain-containing protein [Pyrenochaeta sp. MPI-SDFR-AT-0127]|nr:putative adipose-regulatory protein-domain-containing protein [Pyrenochaeta sp. MPI-SDFR-AT-0127]
MKDAKEEYREDPSIIQYATDTLLLPIRIATSPVLLRTYLRTALLFLTSTILFGLAVIAYSSFYYSYIPVRGITVPVYLQFDHGSSSSYLGTHTDGLLGGKTARWPYGVAHFQGLVDRQKYDVVVEMEVPRSETNLKAGNWMVGLEMRGPSSGGGGVRSLLGWDEEGDSEDRSRTATAEDTTSTKSIVLARSRRPALLTYRSRIVELAYRLLRLPLYLIGWHIESEHIEISMIESVIFEQGYRNVPSSLRLEVRSRQPLEVYRVFVRISAKLEGLRWLMYRYWLTSAVIGTSLFWSVEMGVVLFTWAIFTLLFSASTPPEDYKTSKDIKSSGEESIKLEQPETEPDTPFSDTSRTFPTLSSQQPLSYTSPKEERTTPALEDIPTREDAEADDEEDDFVLEEPPPLPRVEREGIFTDSGIGTSLESSVERGLARRRSGRLKEDLGS